MLPVILGAVVVGAVVLSKKSGTVNAGSPSPASPVPAGASLQSIADGAARDAGIDTALLRAIIQVESGWNPNAFNPEDGTHTAYVPGSVHDTKGSFGLCQVRGVTAKGLKKNHPDLPDLSATPGVSLLDPAVNCAYASALLAELSGQLDTTDPHALSAAYNGGPKAGQAYLDSGTSGNVAYVTRVMSHYV